MAIGIVPGSVKMLITRRPQVYDPVPAHSKDRLYIGFLTSPLNVLGEATLTGAARDSPAGWTLGFIQVLLPDRRKTYWRGARNEDGSILQVYSKPPQACVDCSQLSPVNELFVTIHPDEHHATAVAGAVGLPVTLTAKHQDQPQEYAERSLVNPLTNKRNYFAEIQVEERFCTILSLKDPGRKGPQAFNHLLHFYWSVAWHARLRPQNFESADPGFEVTIVNGTKENKAVVEPILRGPPKDLQVMRVLTVHQSENCGQMTKSRLSNQNSPTWQDAAAGYRPPPRSASVLHFRGPLLDADTYRS